MFEKLEEVNIFTSTPMFDFRFSDSQEPPYKFHKYFNIKDNYVDFIENVIHLIRYPIMEKEIQYLKEVYSVIKIRNRETLSTLIQENKKKDLIKSFIINKRMEHLEEYLQSNSFENKFVQYARTHLKSLYTQTQNILNKYYFNL